MVTNVYFILNSDKELEINKPEAKKVDEYRVLFDRDKGGVGDPTGKKQLIAGAEMLYIYYIYDFRSPFYNLPMKEKKEKAKKDSKLPDNWREDKEIDKAVIRYKEDLKLSSQGNAFVAAERAYYTIAQDTNDMLDEIGEYKQIISKRISALKGKKIEKLPDTDAIQLIKELTANYDNIVSLQTKVIKNISSFEPLGDNVKKLATKFIESGGSLKTPVGGGTLGNREE